VVTDAGHERVQGDLLGAGGLGRLHRPAELVDEGGAPEDPFIPLVGLPAPAEGGAHGPAALGPQEPPALELGPAALGEPRGDEGVVGVMGDVMGDVVRRMGDVVDEVDLFSDIVVRDVVDSVD